MNWQKWKALVLRYYDVLAYLFFGGLTTAVNFLVFWLCSNWLELAGIRNIIAWVAAVGFAFLTNKPFVFKSHDWSAAVTLPELGKFVSCRLGSGALETVLIFVTVDCLLWNATWMKLIASVIVLVLNYVGSTWFVFRKKENR